MKIIANENQPVVSPCNAGAGLGTERVAEQPERQEEQNHKKGCVVRTGRVRGKRDL